MSRAVITSPVPTVEQAAAKLGVSRKRVQELAALMDRIMRRGSRTTRARRVARRSGR